MNKKPNSKQYDLEDTERKALVQEATELMKIFGSILQKSE
jgi:hypothetical protein